jgi:catechol 2,3-dioxygenase-like lactoylglutathione lyase family enzyme
VAKPVKLAHVVYMTRRFDEMVHWYADVFEAAIVYRNPALAFLTYDDEHHRFAFANLDVLKPAAVGVDDRGEIGVNHVGFTYAGISDLLLTYDRLKNAGVRPYWTVHHGTTLSLYYRDPDGNRLEFQVDCGTVEQANAYMASEAFAANPIGVRYDADQLLARYRAGASPIDLVQMPHGSASEIPLEHGMS